MSIKTRVRGPHKHAGLILLAIISAVMHMFFVRTVNWICWTWIAASGNISLSLTLWYCAWLFLPTVWAIFLGRCCQHKAYAFTIGLLFGSIWTLSAWISGHLDHISSNWNSPATIMQYVLSSLGLGLAFGIICLLTVPAYRWLFSKIIEQDGTLCPGCGYCVSYCVDNRCSECGVDLSSPTRPQNVVFRVADALWRRRILTLICLVAISTTVTGIKIQSMRPFTRFRDRFSEHGVVYYVSAYPRGVGVTRAIADVPDKALILEIYRGHIWESAYIEIGLGAIANVPASNLTMPPATEGDPRIVCRLTPPQTEFVLAEDIPKSLIDALLSKAQEVGWKPAAAAAATAPTFEVLVDSEAHFPAR